MVETFTGVLCKKEPKGKFVLVEVECNGTMLTMSDWEELTKDLKEDDDVAGTFSPSKDGKYRNLKSIVKEGEAFVAPKIPLPTSADVGKFLRSAINPPYVETHKDRMILRQVFLKVASEQKKGEAPESLVEYAKRLEAATKDWL